MKSITLDLRLALVLVAALVWCGFLIVLRTLWTWSFDYAFLVWNLGLATIPIVVSSLIVRQTHWICRAGLAPVWLLFLPNAPYMITDFIHLRALDSGPLWLDVLMVSSCAGTGLAMGYLSLMQIHSLFIRARKARLGWLVTTGALFLSGFGIYLGRFLRWRSVDLFRDPLLLLSDIAERVFNPLTHYRAWGVTLGFGVFLCLGYVVLMATGMANQTVQRTGASRFALETNRTSSAAGSRR
jgi:uncharacterized membrane protein